MKNYMDRRGFLKYLGAGALALSLGASPEKGEAYASFLAEPRAAQGLYRVADVFDVPMELTRRNGNEYRMTTFGPTNRTAAERGVHVLNQGYLSDWDNNPFYGEMKYKSDGKWNNV